MRPSTCLQTSSSPGSLHSLPPSSTVISRCPTSPTSNLSSSPCLPSTLASLPMSATYRRARPIPRATPPPILCLIFTPLTTRAISVRKTPSTRPCLNNHALLACFSLRTPPLLTMVKIALRSLSYASPARRDSTVKGRCGLTASNAVRSRWYTPIELPEHCSPPITLLSTTFANHSNQITLLRYRYYVIDKKARRLTIRPSIDFAFPSAMLTMP